ncbi:M48 family metallopeptidase [Natranaerofaba carboxydovora]|uniref:M48 family metallopeptidase n=1 Tax=Natranaerofaba carboxydovora TaxID=2742683 RepID=UPI001F13EEF2|nr:M48 family metallopeptidase [Natranaerofaba carboxydovora]UMZ74812.1 Protease HtpX [Natranaerofaba carboxydovora]
MLIEEHIKRNKLKTYLLFGLYIFLFAAVAFLLGLYTGDVVTWGILFGVVFVVMFIISNFFGKNVIAKMTGAREVTREQEPYLYHTIDGLSIAAGINTPKAYIIETDTPNAFAAGSSPKNAIVGVTRGLLNRLNREELEAVIAHEMAHIKNYDIKVATISVVLAGTIVFVAHMMRRSLFWGRFGRAGMGGGSRRGGSGKGGAAVIQILALIVVIIIAPLMARIIQFAISRKREYLADASGAELTGYPEALASALEKISGMQKDDTKLDNDAIKGLFIVNPSLEDSAGAVGSEQTDVMSFSGKRKSSLFSTHPDVKDRIERLRSM